MSDVTHGATRPLTDRQLLVWLEQELARAVPANNMVAVFTITAAATFDVERFRQAFASVVAQSDALRTVFAPAGAEAGQRVRSDLVGEVEVVDLASPTDAAFQAWFDARRQRPLALEERAFDAALVRRGGGEIAWYLCLHHLITDATSFALIYRRTLAAYLGEPIGDLPAFADFVEYSRQRADGAEQQASLRFWRDRGTDRLEPVRLYGRIDPRTTAYSRRRSFALPAAQLAALSAPAAGAGGELALASALAAVVLAYVHRVSGNRRVGLGLPVANRPGKRFRDTIGLFMEVVALRVEVEDADTFASLAGKVRNEMHQALLHSRCCTSNPTHNRAYEVMLNFQTAKFPALLGPTRTELSTGTTGFGADATPLAEGHGAGGSEPLVITVHDYADSGAYELTLDCNRAVFDEVGADRAAAHLRALLAGSVAAPARPLAEIEIVGADERAFAVERCNATRVARAPGQNVLAMFEAQAARTPDHCAVRCGEASVDYATLAARVAHLGARLRALGVQPDACVAVLMDRSPELLVALLAVWKVGAAYVPLDPRHPPARLAQIMADASPALVLTTSALQGALAPAAGRGVLCLDAAAGSEALVGSGVADDDAGDGGDGGDGGSRDPVDRLAYVLFTSGSTGRPKGVEVTHAMLANFLLAAAVRPGCDATDRVLALTSVSFDIAACELFLPLVVGATVDLIDHATATDGRRLAAHLEKTSPTLVQATPATWRMLIDCGWRGSAGLRLWSGGEALPTDLARELLVRGSALWNLYGPTETTVYSTVHRVSADDLGATVPIGRPIDNTRVCVLDAGGRLVPLGVTGELHIGGAGVARGYRGRPELTRARFLPDPNTGPDGPGATMYRTGDLAALRTDGVLVFHGRIDRQLKLRGFRVEPAEVEAALREHADVRDCAVVQRGADATAILVAFVVAAASPSAADLRAFLAARLPDAMLPARFEALAALPLTPNGKVDLASLAATAAVLEAASEPQPVAEPPSGELELRLASLWAEALGVAGVGRHDDFFALGGNSLLAVRLLVRIRAALGADVSLVTLFTRPTVAALAAALGEGTADGSGLIPLQPWGTGTPIFFLRGIHVYQPLADRLGEAQPSYGIFLPMEERLFAPGERGVDLSVKTLAAGYLEVIRARQPHGPYRLGGLSMGGLLAFEIAQRLREVGEEVELLVLLDTWLPRSRRRLLRAWTSAHLRRLARGDFAAVRRVLAPLSLRGREWLRALGILRPRAWPPAEGAQAAAELERLRMDHAQRAAARYDRHIQAYPGRVILFRALDREEVAGWRLEGAFGWEEIVTGKLRVIDVRGEHVGILQPPFVDSVATHLRAALAGAD